MNNVAVTLPLLRMRVDLLAAYVKHIERIRERRNRKRWRTSAFTLTSIGFICVGIAIAPVAPLIQWYAGVAARSVQTLAARFASNRVMSKAQTETNEVGSLPVAADKPLVVTKRHNALAAAGYAQEAAAAAQSPMRALALMSVAQAKAATPKIQAQVRKTAGSADNWVSIPKIGVHMPIVTGENGARALLKGAWLIPDTSTFDRGGNSVLSCHRYLYTKGPRTCFHLDKLKEGDEIVVQWNGTTYQYTVRYGRVIPPRQVSILNNTLEPIITIFTCTPVFTSKNRLYYVADLVEKKVVVKAALR